MNPEFMPQFAPFVVLLFLGTCFALFVSTLVFSIGLLRRKKALTKWAALGVCAIAGAYGALLLGASVVSEEKTLTAAGKKYFCEIDCHLAYSIDGVTVSKFVGAAPQLTTASGNFYVVSLKTWFDENTISSRRGNGTLYPNPRRVVIVGDAGREYQPSVVAQEALRHTRSNWTPLTQPLRPGESYNTDLVFDLPSDVRNPRLFITDDDGVTRFLIGHENSPLHKRILLQLEPKTSKASL
jgi:hypothetical protein